MDSTPNRKNTQANEPNESDRRSAKMVKTTLDYLPMGTDETMPKPGSKLGKASLPEGVTHKMLNKDVLRIAWPSFLELVLTQITSMVDQMMVGQISGSAGVLALAAVGLSAQPKFLLMTVMMSLNIGSTAMVARFRGQNNREKANVVLRQSLLFNLLLATIFMILGIVFTSPLLRFMGGSSISAETYGYASDYFRIQMYGFVPLCLTFTVTAVLRGIGDTRTPLIYNTIANVVNVIFNYLLIYGKFGFPEMKVAGASLATVIGQSVAFVIAAVFVFNKKRYIYLSFREKFKVDLVILGNVISIGVPAMIEQLFMRTGVIIYTRTVAGLGDTAYATHNVCMNIQAMSFMTGQAFANSATTLMGQSIGKRRIDMAQLYTRSTRLIGLCVSVVLGLALSVFGRTVVSWYTADPDVIALGGSILIMVGCVQPFQSSQFITSGALRGAGDTKFTAMVMFITVLIVRSSLALLLVNVFRLGLWGAWYALMADQLLRTLLVVLHYNSGKWRFMKIRGQQ